MELWIRSQSRKNLMKVEDIVANDNYIEVYKMNDESTRIAEYETPERALEVLDEIQKLLMPISEYKQEIDNLTINYKNIDTSIYEMPKE